MQQQQQQQAQNMKADELNQHKLSQMFHQQQKFNQLNPAMMQKGLANPFMSGKETCIDSIKENSATFKP
jgi:hypothetical protein